MPIPRMVVKWARGGGTPLFGWFVIIMCYFQLILVTVTDDVVSFSIVEYGLIVVTHAN